MKTGMAGRMAAAFVNSKLTPLIIVATLLLGVFATLRTPREEEPQIIVPMADVIVQMPGATSADVERRVTVPMEKFIWEIPGVEYVYSTSGPGRSMSVVRFKVGEDQERAFVRLREKLQSHFDEIPPGATQPIIKPRSIDDVPILALTLHSGTADAAQLQTIAERVEDAVKQVDNVSETSIIGGRRRELRITLDRDRIAGHGLSMDDVVRAIQATNNKTAAGAFDESNEEFVVKSGDFVRRRADLETLVVAEVGGRPVSLSEVATIRDEPEELRQMVLFGYGAGAKEGHSSLEDAVTISVAKRRGTNAIEIAHAVLQKVDSLKGVVIPANIEVSVTRNYGETAAEKSGELLFHMAIAVVSVSVLIGLALGRREALVVLIAIPVTLALTLLVFNLYGYTLNRITLFALIFSIGILVDDAIVVVENVVRHMRMPVNEGRPLAQVAVEAVDEVGNPTILATLAVIAAILPMAFVGGLMGPYMRPIPVGASAAMIFSLLVAFIVTPWAAVRLLQKVRHSHGHAHGEASQKEDSLTRLYRKAMDPLLHNKWARAGFFGLVAVLLLGSMSLVALRAVTVKMLPFDNKNEFQVIVDMPTGTTLEETARVARALAEYGAKVPEVENYQIYIGTASPYNFNGLVRHYFMRSASYQADIQVNLLPKHARKAQSHDIVKRIRGDVAAIAKQYGARVKIAEVPPGPPVLQTLVAEVYGPDEATRLTTASKVKEIFHATQGVTDVDWYQDDDQVTYRVDVDRKKAGLAGVDVATISRTIALTLEGMPVGLMHDSDARSDVAIRVRVPREDRSNLTALSNGFVRSQSGALVPIAELTEIREVPTDKARYRKNLLPVIYVTADVTGRQESPVYAILAMNREIEKLRLPDGAGVGIVSTHLPESTQKPTMKWDGEWHITYEVFRDLGIAFAAVLILIYIAVVAWFQNYKTPLAIMAPIPLTLVGILPGHWLMGAFFTATSMIGFIAGAGIIVRNSIILVDFIELRRSQGVPLDQAVIDAGATRFRPMLLTAAAVMVGSVVILFDPIFQGLAISLMAGEIASTLLSRLAVPVLYYLQER
jgi:multidrug efflux pump subunit AcrB